MPALRIGDEYAHTYSDQIDELYRSLFPAVEAQSTSKAVRTALDSSWPKLITREIEQALNEQSLNKAPGPDKINKNNRH